jgi:hypothetical protein
MLNRQTRWNAQQAQQGNPFIKEGMHEGMKA